MKPNLYKLLSALCFFILISVSSGVYAQYCTSNLYYYGCQFGDYIDNCSVGSINQTSTGCPGGASGYSDYTSLSTNLEQGSTYTLTVSVGTYGEYVSMWIDLNDDQIFEPSEKLISYLYCPTPFINYSANFVVPVFSTPGNHRMRVRSVSYTFPIDPCLEYNYGEVHDYTANVVPPSNMIYVSSTTTQTNTSTTSAGTPNVEIIGVQVVTSGSLNPLILASFTINSNGTTNFAGDVSNVKVYYTGTNPNFGTSTLYGSSTNLSTSIAGNQVLVQGTNYFWVAYDLSPTAVLGDYVDAECTEIKVTGGGNQVPSVTAPPGNRQLNYCSPTNTGGCNFAYIDGVEINTLSNTLSMCNGSIDGYVNYGPLGSLTTSLELGSIYSITLTGPTFEPVGMGVWIDFNNDADFDDAGEFVFSSPTYTTGVVSGSVSVPSNASLGDHRMRVRAKDYGTVSSGESCTTFSYGEAEDYTITLVNATPMVYTSSTTTQDNTSSVTPGSPNVEIIGIQIVNQGSLSPFNATSFTINSNGSTNFASDVSSVKVYYSGTNPNFSTSTLFGSAANLASPITGSQPLNPGTNYFWVAYDLSSTSAIGDAIDAECTQITMTGAGGTHVPSVTAPAGNRVIDYCVPTTTYGCYYGYIDGVIFNTLSNTGTGCNGNVDGYINYAPAGNLTTSVEQGSTYNLTITGSTTDGTGFGVWIDYNNDGDFADANEFVYSSPFPTTDPQYGSITIPNNASYIGNHRMRVRSKENSTISASESCGLFLFYNGESEDYTITITPPGPMSFLSTTTTQTNLDPVPLGQSDVEILGIQVAVNGSLSPFAVTSFSINTNGCTDPFGDLTNLKIYSSGTSPSFSTATLFGSTTNLSASVITGNQTLSPGINYFWVAYDVSASGSLGDYLDAECTQVVMSGAGGTQVPTVTAPSGFRVLDYCTPTAINGCYYAYVDGVTLNTLVNTFTNCNGSINGYIQYAPGAGTTTSLALGETYNIQLDGSPFEGEGFGVWIDYNGDGDFDDADEFVYSSPYIGYGSQYGTITTASNPAYVGDRRMRVRAKDYTLISSYEACADFFTYGETEDYTITLTPAVTSMSYVSSTTTQNNLASVNLGEQNTEIIGIQVVTSGALNPFSATSFLLNSTGSTDFAGDVSGIKIYYTGNNPVFSTATLFGSATNLSSAITGSQTLAAGTNYFWVAYDVSTGATLGDYLDAGCDEIVMSGAAGSQTPDVTDPFGNRQINLCVPTYGTPCSSGDYIDNFTFNTLSNLFSGCNGNVDNYIYYDPTTFTTSVQAGATYPMTLQCGFQYAQGFAVWIDYNNNADFGDPGEFVYASPSAGFQVFSTNVTIPVDPSFYGDRRMRVRCTYNAVPGAGDYCSNNFYYGETEDYTITITAPPSCTGLPVAGITEGDPSVLCSSGSLSTLTLSGFTPAADIAIQWQQSPDGSSWSNIPGATSATYDAAVTGTTYYEATVTCTNSGQSAISASTIVKVGGNEQINSVTGATVCGQGIVNLQATGNSDYVLWYPTSTGGTPLYYSASPSTYTPFINSNTTYYAAAATGNVNVGNVGATDYNIGAIDQYWTYAFDYFSVYDNCTLEGVYVYPAAPGNVIIQWTDQFYNVLQTVTAPVTSADVNQKTFIPLNFVLTPGVNYHLGWAFGSVNMYSNDFGAVYPYEIPDVISITGSSFGGSYYFYFYDWQVNYSKLCESPVRTPVDATVTAAAGVTITPDPANAIICNGSGGSVTLSAAGPYNSFTWSPADGLNSTIGNTVSANPAASTSYVVTATDGTCTSADTIAVNLVDPPALTVSATPDAICSGGTAQLSAVAPALTYNVSEIPFAPVTGITGTVLTLADDQLTSALPIGFNFNFYGIDYSDFYLSSNGYISFDPLSGAGCCTGQFLPNYSYPRNLIAFPWEDFAPNLGGTITYFTTGTAPSRKLVVNFDNVPHYSFNGPVDISTFQLIIYESSNIIEMHITNMPGNPNGVWNGHTEGIENADATLAVTVPGRNSDATWTATNDAWRFSPPQYGYSWTPANTLSDASIFNPTASPTTSTTYTVTVTDNFTLCASSGTATVNVVATPVAGTISAPNDEFCQSGQAVLTLDGYSPGATIIWQNSPNSGGPYTNIGGATNDTYTTPMLSASTYYVAKVSCANSVTSAEEAVLINYPPASPVAIDGGHCGPGVVTIGATGTGNGPLNWYYSQTGNSFIGSGTPFNTPFINTTTNFWVEEGQAAPTPLTTSYAGFYSQNGAMFDITALNEVYITSFDVNLGFGTSDFEIYYKSGTAVGSETNPAAWTFAGSAIGVPSAGFGVPTPIPANLFVHIPAGETYAFYVVSSNYNYIYYEPGTLVGNIAASDNNIQVKEGSTDYYPFGYPSSPSKWNGTVHYMSPSCASPRIPVEAAIYAPQVLASASPTVICQGETIQLSAQNSTPGNFNFEWSPAIPGMVPQDGLDDTVSVTPQVTMTFTVSVADPGANCDTSVLVNVTVNPTPAVLISGLDPQYYNTDPPVTMIGVPAGGTFSGPGVSGNAFSPASVGLGTYIVTYTYTDANGCTGSTSQSVNVVALEGIAGITDDYDLFIYPNPNMGMFTLDLQLPDPASEVVMRVFNMIGQPVFENSFGAAQDELKKTFDFSQWAAGSYFVQVSIDGKVAYRKLTIQK